MPPFRSDDMEGARCVHVKTRERCRPGPLRKAPGVGRGQVNRFNPGQVVATPGALAALEASGESLSDYLTRHLSGDWGDVDAEDARENELSPQAWLAAIVGLHAQEWDQDLGDYRGKSFKHLFAPPGRILSMTDRALQIE